MRSGKGNGEGLGGEGNPGRRGREPVSGTSQRG